MKKESPKKSVYFIVNKKGGVGKSLTSYFLALRHQNDEKACFFDTDTTRRATMNQCAFLGNRLEAIEFLSNGSYDNTQFNFLLSSIVESPYQTFVIDCGGQESLQLIHVLNDYLEVYENLSQDVEFKFIVPLSGVGDSYKGSQEYITELAEKTQEKFQIFLVINEGLFNSPKAGESEMKIEGLEKLASEINHCSILRIPAINASKSTDREILEGAAKGWTLEQYNMFSKSKLGLIIKKLP